MNGDDHPAGRPAFGEATEVAPAARASPTTIGPYRLLQKLGEGGMGEVWEAEQTEPVWRRVAVKIIKLGMDTREVVTRFEAERQALAMMDHPSIARVFDAGATESGRPYFAMELVSGVPITDYCDRHRLGTRDRLKLFMQVCEGVQHAHQKGIIHRDLKPSNVMVTLQDGRPVPKIIDFGVAKATAHQLTDKTLFTQLGVLIGTPEYMSPEQAELTGLDIDTRSDIYSLGMMLYQLLAGLLPFDPQELRRAALAEIQRRIREEEPPKPSTRLARLDPETATRLAASRGGEAKALVRRLEGDLDWIVMKALDKDRTRRYETASAFAMDVARHLADEPVRARPPSAAYRARKFVRRHTVGVAAAAVVVLALLLGIAGTTAGLLRARRAEAEARREAETARQVSDFLVGLFRVSDPGEARGNTVTAREILDKGARQIERELAEEPAVRARLMQTMGEVYDALGLYREAAPLLERALATREQALGAGAPEVGETLTELGSVYRLQGRYEEAEAVLRRALGPRERAAETAPLPLAATLEAMARLEYARGRFDEAEELFRRALAIEERVLGPADPGLAGALSDLAKLQYERGKYDEAERLHKRTLDLFERSLGADHPQVAASLQKLADVYRTQGKNGEAERLYERSLAIREKALGPDHPDLAVGLNNLASLYTQEGRSADARRLYERALAIWERTFGPDHPNVAASLHNLGNLYLTEGRDSEAESLYERSLAIKEKVMGPEDPSVALSLQTLAYVSTRRGKYSEAEDLLRRALSIQERKLAPENLYFAYTFHYLANVYRGQGRLAEADGLYRRAIAQWEGAAEPGGEDWATILRDYATLLRRDGRGAEAAALDARLVRGR